MQHPAVILIAGPTASGKSALAMRLAERLGGTVVNADSMQVYRDLRIITARPSPEEEERVPHRLYGQVDAAVNYSVGQWCRDAGAAMAEIAAQGGVAILVGGTGLYFKALMSGLAAVPPVPADMRERVRSRVASEGAPALHAELMRLDPATARRITVNDRSRISRALEVVLATGRPLSDWHAQGLPPLLVPWLIRHLHREISLDEAGAGAVMDTRRYAKRQLTWFRNQIKDWPWAAAEDAEKALEKQFTAA
jgi:tRNA dimethylallyltransferase